MMTHKELLKLLEEKHYLGDSVYAFHDGYHFILITHNGYADDPRNRIALEPAVFANLNRYREYVANLISDYNRIIEE